LPIGFTFLWGLLQRFLQLGFYLITKILMGVFILFLISDMMLLFFTKKGEVLLTREIPDRLSNGDENRIEVYVQNSYPYPLSLEIYDEIPSQFQLRDFKMEFKLDAYNEKRIHYTLVPKERGEYIFGVTNVLYATVIGLLMRHKKFGEKETPVPVYPSYLKMRKYELLAISNRLSEVGVKRVRRIGSHTEFDQIKDYVKGDNYRTINWRATAKRGKLMVNQYQDERSQNVYNVIDMGRTMQMPFNGMSLLDYAINAALILTNTALQKHDKAGLITFNKTVETYLHAERKHETLTKILDRLYKQETGFYESDFAALTAGIKRKISHRSLLILYTNFETITSLERYISFLRILAKSHVIIVVIFENKEIEKLSHEPVSNMEELYIRTIAEKHMYDKKLIVKELLKNGIFSVLTKPENLTAGLINKYLELKDTGRF
jgi:uncharacterized protein (DUF58 family)